MQAVGEWWRLRESRLFKDFLEFKKFFKEILLRTKNNVLLVACDSSLWDFLDLSLYPFRPRAGFSSFVVIGTKVPERKNVG